MSGLSLGVRSGLIAAVTVCALTIQPAAAIQWSPVSLISDQASGRSTMTAGGVVHVAYHRGDTDAIHYRRSIDGGATWQVPIVLSNPGTDATWGAAIGHGGQALDVAWIERVGADRQIWYRSSPDSGDTWTDPLALTPACRRCVGYPSVARSHARVIVVWTDPMYRGGDILSRISDDGGQTFGPPVKVAFTTEAPADYDGLPSVAFTARGATTQLIWKSSPWVLKTRRSMDRGTTWSPAMTLADNARWASLMTAGQKVVVGWNSQNDRSQVRMRRSLDGGESWRPVQTISHRPGLVPVFAYGGHVLRLAVSRCQLGTCQWQPHWATFYRTSPDVGRTWSAWSNASGQVGTPRARPVGIGALPFGKSVVVYSAFTGNYTTALYARRVL
jgi:hypothetical protein